MGGVTGGSKFAPNLENRKCQRREGGRADVWRTSVCEMLWWRRGCTPNTTQLQPVVVVVMVPKIVVVVVMVVALAMDLYLLTSAIYTAPSRVQKTHL